MQARCKIVFAWPCDIRSGSASSGQSKAQRVEIEWKPEPPAPDWAGVAQTPAVPGDSVVRGRQALFPVEIHANEEKGKARFVHGWMSLLAMTELLLQPWRNDYNGTPRTILGGRFSPSCQIHQRFLVEGEEGRASRHELDFKGNYGGTCVKCDMEDGSSRMTLTDRYTFEIRGFKGPELLLPINHDPVSSSLVMIEFPLTTRDSKEL